MNDYHDPTITQYSYFLHNTSWYAHAHERNAAEFAYLTLGLVGEAGEFADEFKKIVREDGFDQSVSNITEGRRLHLVDELGDVLWYLVRLCDMLGVSIRTLMAMNTAKLYARLEELNKINTDEIPWPFTAPELSRTNVANARILMAGE